MKFSRTARAPLAVAVSMAMGVTTLALAGVAPATASAAAKPAFKAAAPAKSLGGIKLGVGDQVGTGAEAILEAAGLYNAKTGKLKDGLKVTFNDFASGPLILEAIESGSDQIGGVGDAPPVFADATAANDLVIVGTLAQSSSAYGLLVAKNSGITSISQLKGKTIGAQAATSSDYDLLTILQKNNVPRSSVSIDTTAGLACQGELASGAIQACVTSSPDIELGEDLYGEVDLYNTAKYGSPYSYQVASGSALKNPKYVLAIRDYLTELDAGYKYVLTHEHSWAVHWAAVTGEPLVPIEAATLDDQYTPIPVGSVTVAAEQGLVNAFVADGEIPTKYNIAKYVTSDFSDSVTGKWPKTT